ncbi:MAG: TCP-1/cpn60 chaperonin family protein [Methanosarcinales archaeon]|nr:MAG: TCP-1/cpn60 chaperonin family protein [Methanosarcinales archaeon]
MVGQLSGQPVLILREGSQRTRGREAQSMNIMAAKAVAEAVRTTLGPKGMDKMLVDSMGDVVITNDGVTILKEMDIEHPAAKMMVEIAKTQEDEVGDGTTTAVVLAGELLKKAEALLDQDVHPVIIASGYRMAAQKSYEILNAIASPIAPDDESVLENIASTAMTGKGAEAAKMHLAKLCVKAVRSIVEDDTVDMDNIKVEKRVGGGIEDSELIEGMVIDKERVHSSMPKKVENAKILLLDTAIELKGTEMDAEISITSPEQMQAFLAEEERMLKKIVNAIKDSGANVVFCQKGIDDMAQHYLAKAGILVARRVKKSDIDKLAKATGASIITRAGDITKGDLGEAGLVEEKKVADEDMIFVTKCKNPKAVSMIVHGGTEHVVDEVDRAIHDALRVVGVAIEDKKLVVGGGSSEVEVALQLRKYASTVGGREQLAIEAFADALEVIPRTLAENAGLNTIDSLVSLRSKHEKGDKNAGLDVYTGSVIDMQEANVLEPLRIKTQAIGSAAESAVMILRIDDVMAASSLGKNVPEMPPGMGGMDGMPPMM